MADSKRIRGAGGGGGGGGGGNSSPAPQPYQPVYTADSPGLKSTSFAQLQFLISDGEIEGPVHGNSIEGLERSVYLDRTPIRVGGKVSPQPADLVFSWGRPSSEQTGVPGFTRVSNVEGVDQAVKKASPVTKLISVSDPTGTWLGRVMLTFQALFRSTDKGDIYGETVDIGIEYTDNLGVTRSIYNGPVEGKFSGQFQKEYEFQFQGQAPWTVRVIRKTDDDQDRNSGSNTYRTQFNFSSVGVSLDQRLNYPYSSILSIGIDAERYQSLPAVSIEVKGMRLAVPSNYDASTRTYTGVWDGIFTTQFSDNPAWVLYDLLRNDRYGLGSYISADQVDKWTLYRIAKYCDEMVPKPGGGTEPRFTCNLVLQTAGDAWKVLQQLCTIFRGLLYSAGGTVIAVQDRPLKPVFTFNESNTIEEVAEDGKVSTGNFSYAGVAKRARHTVVLVSWDDPADEYQPRVEYVADEEGLARYGYRPLDLRLMGVTSRGQALRAAQWALLSEAKLDDTVSFRTNEIGAAVRPGDVIAVLDPMKAGKRYGGRIKAINGDQITLDAAPVVPTGGWAGATFSYMAAQDQTIESATIKAQPILVDRQVASVAGDVVTLVANAAALPPVVTFPWMLQTPDRKAQLCRTLTVEEQEGGVYAFTALRYREDIYNKVDFNTPLNDNEDYLFKVAKVDPPTIDTAQVIWDNNQAKIDVSWLPPKTAQSLNGFDLTIREYRLQWQGGTLRPDGTVLYDGVWREVARQYDNREQISLDQLNSDNRFKVRVLAVSRLGLESTWAEKDVDDITVWFPMPDLGGQSGSTPPVANALLSHLNQSTGGQLFSIRTNVSVPPYVTGYLLEAKPSRPLTTKEASGLNPPDQDGYYFISQFNVGDYYSVAFHALVNWDVRVSFATAITGLSGKTYARDLVDRRELAPPGPVELAVVTEPAIPSRPLRRRFSWDQPVPPPFTENWPTGRVSDIVAYDIRFKAGTTADWDKGYSMYSDGIPGDQKWFETVLFDSGQWVIMVRSRDRTGWLSDEMAFVKVNLGDVLPTNVVVRFDMKDMAFPGQLTNANRINRSTGLMYPDPRSDAMYQLPHDDEFYEGAPGNNLQQVDATSESVYIMPLSVTENGAGIIVYTQADCTYQWFIRKVGAADSDLLYHAPLGDPMYGSPGSDYFYHSLSVGLSTEFHPLAPFERVDAGVYELGVVFRSVDDVKLGEIHDIDVVLDYPDVVETFNDVVIPAGGKRLKLKSRFRELKAVSLTLQDTQAPGVPQTAIVSGKDRHGFTVSCFDLSGTPVEGMVDATCVGF